MSWVILTQIARVSGESDRPGAALTALQTIYTSRVAEPARRRAAPARGDDTPSLDPLAIERAYRRERARRRAQIERRYAARRSGLRFWWTLLILCFVAALIMLAAWHQVQTLFGV